MAEQEIERPLIQELDRFSLWAKNPSADPTARQSRLAFGTFRNNPRISVFTNDPADTEKSGVIPAPMDPVTFFTFLTNFEEICKGPVGKKGSLDNYTKYKDEQGIYGDKILLSKTIYGKDEDGICWLSIIANNRPKIKFEYIPSDFHKFFDTEGADVTRERGSMYRALETIRLLRIAMGVHCTGMRPRNLNSERKNIKSIPESKKATDMSFDADVTF